MREPCRGKRQRRDYVARGAVRCHAARVASAADGVCRGLVVVRDVPGPASVSLLRNSRPVEYTHADGTLTFQVPERVSEDEVVAISWPASVEYTTSF